MGRDLIAERDKERRGVRRRRKSVQGRWDSECCVKVEPVGGTVRRPVCWRKRVRQRLDCEENSLEGGEHRDDI